VDIEIRIDRLVLEGIDLNPQQKAHLTDALCCELEQLLSNAGTGMLFSRISTHVRAPDVIYGQRDESRMFGRNLARSIYERMRA
jgi:hypothetical protein